VTDKEKRYSEELERCRNNIVKTKSRIEYHREILKKQEKNEISLISKLEKVKMTAFYEMIHKGGYDIDSLREAMKNGDFSAVIVSNPKPDTVENTDTKTEEKPKEELIHSEQTEKILTDERKI
jgi:RNase H-fold protein (predicted Holliday junction resolvase)